MYNNGYMNDYGTTYVDTTGIMAVLGGFFAIFGIIMMIVGIVTLISQWKIYKKAGKGGWECIIPIYNFVVLLQIVELPVWYILLFLVPIANIYAIFKIYIELAHKFGKSTGFGIATVFFNIICLPILAFSKNCVYQGASTDNSYQQMNNNQVNVPNNNPNNTMNYSGSPVETPISFDQNINTSINQIPSNINDTSLNNNPQPMGFTPLPTAPQQVAAQASNNNPQELFQYNAPVEITQPEQQPSLVQQPQAFNQPVPTPNLNSQQQPMNAIQNMGEIIQPAMNNNPQPIQPVNIAPQPTMSEQPNLYGNTPQMQNFQQPLNVIPNINQTPQQTQNPNNTNM